MTSDRPIPVLRAFGGAFIGFFGALGPTDR